MDLLKEEDSWRARYNRELNEIYRELDVVTTVRKTCLQWFGHTMRMGEVERQRRFYLRNQETAGKSDTQTQVAGRRDDLARAGVRNWRRTRTGRYGGRPLRKPRHASGCWAADEWMNEVVMNACMFFTVRMFYRSFASSLLACSVKLLPVLNWHHSSPQF